LYVGCHDNLQLKTPSRIDSVQLGWIQRFTNIAIKQLTARQVTQEWRSWLVWHKQAFQLEAKKLMPQG
jgi:hypothetical protein